MTTSTSTHFLAKAILLTLTLSFSIPSLAMRFVNASSLYDVDFSITKCDESDKPSGVFDKFTLTAGEIHEWTWKGSNGGTSAATVCIITNSGNQKVKFDNVKNHPGCTIISNDPRANIMEAIKDSFTAHAYQGCY